MLFTKIILQRCSEGCIELQTTPSDFFVICQFSFNKKRFELLLFRSTYVCADHENSQHALTCYRTFFLHFDVAENFSGCNPLNELESKHCYRIADVRSALVIC